MAEEKIGEVFVEVRAGSDRMASDLNSIKGKVNKSAESLGASYGNMFKKGLGAAGIALSVTALFSAIKNVVSASLDAARAQAGVEQAVKRTGGAAGYTSEKLIKMASDLQDLVGVDDDEILKGVTKQLLTFTNIAGDSFKRAQVAVLDLNAVINEGAVESLTSQSIQLGKALENPIAGVGALSRAGVTFTDVQKNQIKNFMQQNDLMGAQNIILTEIENKYGGQAEALAKASGGTKQFAASFGDLKEAAGGFFIPILNDWMPALTKALKGWTSIIETAISKFRNLMKLANADAKTAFMITLPGTTPEWRSGQKSDFQEQIKKLSNDVSLLAIESNKAADIMDGYKDGLEKQITDKNKEIAQVQGYIAAIDEYELKLSSTNKKDNEQWNAKGKVFGEVKLRLQQVTDEMDNFVKGSAEWNKLEAERKKLELYVNPKESTGNDKKAELIKKYYETLKAHANEYLKFQFEQIDKEAKELEKLKNKDVDIDKFKYEAKKKALAEYVEYAKEKLKEITGGNDLLSNKGEFARAPIPGVAGINPRFTINKTQAREKPELFDGDQFEKEIREKYGMWIDMTQQSVGIIQSNFSSLWQNIFGEANSVFEQIAQMIASTLLTSGFKLLLSFLGIATGGAAGAVLAVAGRASGGPVSANKPYLVGDGPGGRITPYTELFVPNQSGTIIPTGATNQIMNSGGGMSDKKLDTLIGAVKALNMNLIKKDFSPIIDVKLNSKEVSRHVTAQQNEFIRTGFKSEDFK